MSWEAYLEQWRTHSKLHSFQHKVDQAIQIARDGIGSPHLPRRMFAAISGGKDSTAMLGILKEAGVDVPCVHGTSSMAIPESEQTSAEACEQLGFKLEVVEPQEDPWDVLRNLPGSMFEPKNWTRFCYAAGEIQVLIWYRISLGLEGAFIGLRAKESKHRLKNAVCRGAVYHIKNGNSWASCPIQWWSTDDVFAFLVTRDLPIHPYYRRIYEECGVSPLESRVSMAIPNEYICAHGALVYLRKLYPDLWHRLVDARPEIQMLG